MPLSRDIIDALWPDGDIWAPVDDGDLDKLLDGIAENAEIVINFLDDLAKLRSPELTTILDDLETEYGIMPDSTVAESTRRARLLSIKTATDSDGTARFLEERLQLALFDLQVHRNAPIITPSFSEKSMMGNPESVFGGVDVGFGGDNLVGTFVDPDQIISYSEKAVMGNPESVFGGDGVQFDDHNGQLVVNGPVFNNQNPITYDVPDNSAYWPLFFFVGGDAIRDDSGQLVSVERVDIPIERKVELIRLIVRYKPIFSWCGLIVRFV